ncbi:MAG: TolC family protein [Deltaproteobacteria bacterium]|nr:TolC family protein [Deltaproteobacteria bacterium]
MKALCFALVLSACTAASLRGDFDRVRELVPQTPLPEIAGAVQKDEPASLPSAPLDADAAVRLALVHNRDLRATLRDMGVERGALMQAGVVANPLVEFELLPEKNSLFELRVEYEVTSLILTPMRARAAAADLDAARYRAAGAVVQLGYDVRAAFYALQAAEQRVAIGLRSLDAFAASRDAAEALYAAGNIPQLDLEAEVLGHERTKATLLQLEVERVHAYERLHRLIGLPSPAPAFTIVAAPTTIPDVLRFHAPFSTGVADNSLDLEETRRRLDALAKKAGYSALSGWLPEINLDVHALIGDPDAAPATPADTRWRFGGGVSVRLPIFDQARGTTRTFEAQRDALLERYYAQATALRSQAREATARVINGWSRARQYRDAIVPAQARVLDQTLRQYNAMQISVFTLIEARRAQLDTELEYALALCEYWTAAAAADALHAGKMIDPSR